MPSTYLFAEVEIHDPEIYAEYGRLTAGTITKYGGEWFLDAGSRREMLEGSDEMPFFVSARFPDYAAALSWYNSPEYVPLKQLRKDAVTVKKLMLIEGLP